MVAKKSATRTAASASTEEPTKAQLQRRMEEAREEISQTVAEIKDTVTEQYEAVKETVTETLDWREQFRKHSIAWSLGALAVGYVVGNGIAASLKETTHKKGRKNEGLMAEIYAIGEAISDELSGVAQTVLLPMLTKKVKDKFGIDLSQRLLDRDRASHSGGRAAKKGGAKKSGSKKSSKKQGGARKSTKKSGAK